MNPFLLLFFAIVSEVVATTSLKLSEGFTRPVPSLVVVAGYGLAFYLLSRSLEHIPLGVAYAIWSGVGTAGTVVLGMLLFDELLNPLQGAGIALIIGGVLMVNLMGR